MAGAACHHIPAAGAAVRAAPATDLPQDDHGRSGLLLSKQPVARLAACGATLPRRLGSASRGARFHPRCNRGLAVLAAGRRGPGRGEVGFYWGFIPAPLRWTWCSRALDLTPLHVLGLANPMSASVSLIAVSLALLTTVWGFFHPCQFALAARPAGMTCRHAGLPSLAPHPGRAAGPESRLHAALARSNLRHVPAAKRPAAGDVRHHCGDACFAGRATDAPAPTAAERCWLAGCETQPSEGRGPAASTRDMIG